MLIVGLAAITAKAQSVPSIISSIQIRGTLFCTINGNINSNGTPTPVFSGALVQLQCGTKTVLASAITNASGVFIIPVNPVQFVLLSLQTNCYLFVATPLATCNSSLSANGNLISNLRYVESTVTGTITLTSTGFYQISKQA
ncbi:Pollen ole e 1 allergen and extensin family protein [Thalictrum thalictroides]|uniref:Pollen ole e 1 allergen and extensin family protein n=1 Tax=Thalictrum thalictroides TaxID=46969 RepID=A0A7J6W024_THATH|nr:Pollen ole e 1 allergen and extensin family protein [Thalictrum thalictroides]